MSLGESQGQVVACPEYPQWQVLGSGSGPSALSLPLTLPRPWPHPEGPWGLSAILWADTTALCFPLTSSVFTGQIGQLLLGSRYAQGRGR